MKINIINNPDQWILTRDGDFVRIIDSETEEENLKKIPNLKIISPYSPVLQYDMWHGSNPAPGSQCQGWFNITGDAWEIMEYDVIPNSYFTRQNAKQADQSIHLDYPH